MIRWLGLVVFLLYLAMVSCLDFLHTCKLCTSFYFLGCKGCKKCHYEYWHYCSACGYICYIRYQYASDHRKDACRARDKCSLSKTLAKEHCSYVRYDYQ